MSIEVFRILSFVLDALVIVLFLRILIRLFIMFEVLNEHHPVVIKLGEIAEAVFKPITGLIQRIVPTVWGIDLSLVIVLLLLVGLRVWIGSLVG